MAATIANLIGPRTAAQLYFDGDYDALREEVSKATDGLIDLDGICTLVNNEYQASKEERKCEKALREAMENGDQRGQYNYGRRFVLANHHHAESVKCLTELVGLINMFVERNEQFA